MVAQRRTSWAATSILLATSPLFSDALDAEDAAGRRVIDHGEEDELCFRPVVGAVLGADPGTAHAEAIARETRRGASHRRHVEVEDLDRGRTRNRPESSRRGRQEYSPEPGPGGWPTSRAADTPALRSPHARPPRSHPPPIHAAPRSRGVHRRGSRGSDRGPHRRRLRDRPAAPRRRPSQRRPREFSPIQPRPTRPHRRQISRPQPNRSPPEHRSSPCACAPPRRARGRGSRAVGWAAAWIRVSSAPHRLWKALGQLAADGARHRPPPRGRSRPARGRSSGASRRPTRGRCGPAGHPGDRGAGEATLRSQSPARPIPARAPPRGPRCGGSRAPVSTAVARHGASTSTPLTATK